MKLNEENLCELFAEGVRHIPELREWMLSKTKFAPDSRVCRLLDKEQMSLRPRKRWWRHWWCAIPDIIEQRETDIFMVFEAAETHRRFALHIENKPTGSKFREGQAAAYEPRGRHMLNRSQFLSHSDFQTVLLAPTSFRSRFAVDAALFDVFLSYEEVARFVPAYAAG
jgi:hypothetical protein